MSKPDALRLAADSVEARKAENELGAMGARLRDAERRIAAEREHCDERLAICNALADEMTTRLTNRTPIVKPVPWSERPWFVATMAVVVTAAVAVPVAVLLARGGL